MKQVYKLPGGLKCGYLGEVHLDTDMTGDHFDKIALVTEESVEVTVLDILRELMDEDPYLLTQAELYYVFLLVKVESISSILKAPLVCQHTVERPNPKGSGVVQVKCENNVMVSYSLGNADVHYCPDVFENPVIKFPFKGVELECLVKPPTMRAELDILKTFREHGLTRAVIGDMNNRRPALEYAKHRMVAYLNPALESGVNFLGADMRQEGVEELARIPFKRGMQAIRGAIEQVDKYAVEHRDTSVTCDACGGKITFQPGLLSGFTM